MKKKHIIFDFDGTIFDSNRVIVASWQEVFRHYTGKEGRVEDIYHTFGETIRYTVKKFFPQANVDEAVQIYRNYQQAHYDGMVGLFDGTREMMDRMVEGGHTLSVVTSRTKVTTLNYMKELGIRDYFDVLITCDDTDKHKPDPTPLPWRWRSFPQNRRTPSCWGTRSSISAAATTPAWTAFWWAGAMISTRRS